MTWKVSMAPRDRNGISISQTGKPRPERPDQQLQSMLGQPGKTTEGPAEGILTGFLIGT